MFPNGDLSKVVIQKLQTTAKKYEMSLTIRTFNFNSVIFLLCRLGSAHVSAMMKNNRVTRQIYGQNLATA
jgi:hypothetical protein